MTDQATLAPARAPITGDSIDPPFDKPVIEIEEQRADPVPHTYVHGRFDGTEARFSFYFPPKEQYQGRFFHNTYPMATSADIGPFPIEFEVATGDLGFTVDSGAYYVQTNNGGVFRAAGVDPAIPAYRVNAAAATFSRLVAARIYGEHRPYGYLFGGSGGAYQTMGAMENTEGVWDGFVPFVSGCNHAIPTMFTVRMHALRVLRQRPVLQAMADAIDVGGSGDPYAGLNDEEAAALREVSLMGFPPRCWYLWETMNSGYFANISGMIPMIDPTYEADFWSKPGYLGHDDATIRAARKGFEATVKSASGGPPWTIELEEASSDNWADAHLVVLTGASAGATLPIARSSGATVHPIDTSDPVAAGGVKAGDKVRLDNGWALALQTYQRHQVPPEPEYYGWDQYRDAAGKPLYPQRQVLVGPVGTINSAGSLLAGNHSGKVIMLAVLMDHDCPPWQADWYRHAAEASKGPGYADSYALRFHDNSHHENPMTALQRCHVVSYGGALQQALRDVAAWAETGVRPAETVYRVEDTQVLLPASAAERKGIQPVVELTANGGPKAEAKVGEPVSFAATIETPPGAGKAVSAEWDFESTGDFPDRTAFDPAEKVSLAASHAYATPGTHFAVLRVASQRKGDAATPYGRIENIARVRVVVS